MLAILESDHICCEFSTRLGIEHSELLEIVSTWPALDDSDQVVELAINNCLNEVLHGISMTPDEWHCWIDQSEEEVREVYRTWAKLRSYTQTGIQ